MKKTISNLGISKINKMIDELFENEENRNTILEICDAKEYKRLYNEIIYKYFDYTKSCQGSRRVAEMIVDKASKILKEIDEDIKNDNPEIFDDCEDYENYDMEEAEEVSFDEDEKKEVLIKEVLQFTYGKLSFNDWMTLSDIFARFL